MKMNNVQTENTLNLNANNERNEQMKNEKEDKQITDDLTEGKLYKLENGKFGMPNFFKFITKSFFL